MARVSITSLEQARAIPAQAGALRAYRDDPAAAIRVHLHELAAGDRLRLDSAGQDSALFLWEGQVMVGDHHLPAGSSLMLESGTAVEIVAQAPARLIRFAAPRGSRADAKAHLLPASRVPGYSEGPEGSALRGRLHADATMASCPLWLHENQLPAPRPDAPPADPDAGIHSHAEDEVIFITAGQMKLGNRLYGPGTALGIAAQTMYGFGTGPHGLSFVNFRPGLPDAIRFKSGLVIDEVGYWRARCATPAYLPVDGLLAARP